MRLADGQVFTGPLEPERHRALQLGVLHEQTGGLVELAAGARRDGRLQITTRRRADHFLPGGGAGRGDWLQVLLALAGRHAQRGEEVFVAPAARTAARGDKHAVGETRFLWVDVDEPDRLPALWALLAERPCHLLVESSAGRAHAYWKLDRPLPATRVIETTGELVEPIERAHLRLIHHLGTDAHGKPSVADPACAERSRVMRLAGTVNGKTGAHARILEADLALPAYPVGQLVGDLPDPIITVRRAHAPRATARTRTSGSARASTSSASPGSSSPGTGSCAAPRTTTGSRRARSDWTRARGGAATRAGAARAARSTTSRRCCSAGPGVRSCAATRSSAPAPTSLDVFGELSDQRQQPAKE